jgi:hypothetical protein
VTTINWPSFSETPISEYSDKIVFCMLLPWLYPGGNGDFYESRSIDITNKYWASQKMYMADGRFARYNKWCFYALNHAEYRRNQVQDQWFFNILLHSEEIPDIDTLKLNLRKNDTRFIGKFQYFARCVPGSLYAHWRNNRAELASRIGHHVEEGNVVPSIFITLSCA